MRYTAPKSQGEEGRKRPYDHNIAHHLGECFVHLGDRQSLKKLEDRNLGEAKCQDVHQV